MGSGLPKPVMVKVLEGSRTANDFLAGCCSVNGHREAMEDAHVSFSGAKGDFFAVCDGHGGRECARYVAARWGEDLEQLWCGAPGALPTAEALLKWVRGVDAAFMESGKEESGTTCTGCFVLRQRDAEGLVDVRVVNVGDSRTIVYGSEALHPNGIVFASRDHKPDEEGEAQRIAAANGGFVAGGRVNGVLAVSRSLGDAELKAGGPSAPVIPDPDVADTKLGCGGGDFIVVACDGVFENAFTNASLGKFVRERLQQQEEGGEGELDLATIAASVCEEAVNSGSKDNVSCIIVKQARRSSPPGSASLGKDQSGVSDVAAQQHVRRVIPGPFTAGYHHGFREAYRYMCELAGTPVGNVLEQRFDELTKLREAGAADEDMIDELDGDFEKLRGQVPQLPPDASSEQRTQRTRLFSQWFDELCQNMTADEHGIVNVPGAERRNESPPPLTPPFGDPLSPECGVAGVGGGGGGGGGSTGGVGGLSDAGSPPYVEHTPGPNSLRPPQTEFGELERLGLEGGDEPPTCDAAPPAATNASMGEISAGAPRSGATPARPSCPYVVPGHCGRGGSQHSSGTSSSLTVTK